MHSAALSVSAIFEAVQLPSFSLRDLVLSCRGAVVFQDRDGVKEGSGGAPVL